MLHAVSGAGIDTVSSGGDTSDWKKRGDCEREAHQGFGSHQSRPAEEDMCGEYACVACLSCSMRRISGRIGGLA